MVTRASPDTLLRTVLRSVARSFYLTLAVVPSDVRAQVGVAYLLARAADTIADTDLIEHPLRLQYLTRFREWVMDPTRREDVLREVQAALLVLLDNPRSGLQTRLGERTLLTHLMECGHLLRSFAPPDQALISQGVGTLSRSEEHTSEIQSQSNLVCRLLLEKKQASRSRGSRPTPGDSTRYVAMLPEMVQKSLCTWLTRMLRTTITTTAMRTRMSADSTLA